MGHGAESTDRLKRETFPTSAGSARDRCPLGRGRSRPVPDRSPKRLLTPSAERRQSLIDVIAEGVVAGDFSPHLDPELAALALLGPIVYCRLCRVSHSTPGLPQTWSIPFSTGGFTSSAGLDLKPWSAVAGSQRHVHSRTATRPTPKDVLRTVGMDGWKRRPLAIEPWTNVTTHPLIQSSRLRQPSS